MKKLPRVSVHEVPPGYKLSRGGVTVNRRHLDLETPFVPYRVSPLPPGVTPIYSVKLGPDGTAKRGSKRARVRG